jgi:hypothetical protein
MPGLSAFIFFVMAAAPVDSALRQSREYTDLLDDVAILLHLLTLKLNLSTLCILMFASDIMIVAGSKEKARRFSTAMRW